MWIIRQSLGGDQPAGTPNEVAPGAFCAAGATGTNNHQKESACKPGPVESNHSSGTCVTASLKQPTRKARGPRVERPLLLTWRLTAPGGARPSLFGLAPDGVCHTASGCPSRGALLPHHFTLASSPSFARWVASAVCFLLHFPSARAAEKLSRVLPGGARTFLHASRRSGCSANSAASLPRPPGRHGRRA